MVNLKLYRHFRLLVGEVFLTSPTACAVAQTDSGRYSSVQIIIGFTIKIP